MSKIETNTIAPSTGTTLTLGESGDTIALGSGISSISGLSAGITMVDQFKLTSDHSNGVITDLARCANTAFGRIGTGMSVSSGIFTFPSTGIYLVMPKVVFRTDSDGDRTMEVFTQVTTNNSSYESIDDIVSGDGDVDGNATNSTATSFVFVDVTDTSNVKVKFAVLAHDSCTLQGGTDKNRTYVTFTRLGDT